MSRRILYFVLVIILILSAMPALAQSSARVVPMTTSLRLRSAPTTSSDTIDYLSPGTTMTIMEWSGDGTWYHVQIDGTGQQGWVAAGFVEKFDRAGASASVPANTSSDTAPKPAPEIPINTSTFSDTIVEGVPILVNLNENALNIYRKGQAMGNRANVFSKVGDSITFTHYFLDNFGRGIYDLDTYWYLDSVIDFFRAEVARDTNSFEQDSIAAQSGWNAYLLQNPEYANAALCNAGETPLECEYRHMRPSIALIMLGTNDLGFVNSYAYRVNMEWIVQTSIDNGVIPVISTIPERVDVPGRAAEFNAILRDIAVRYNIPLWDYHAILATLPNNGLGPDGIHPSGSPSGWVGNGDFKASNLQYGFPVRNLTALHVLHSIWQQVIMRG